MKASIPSFFCPLADYGEMTMTPLFYLKTMPSYGCIFHAVREYHFNLLINLYYKNNINGSPTLMVHSLVRREPWPRWKMARLQVSLMSVYRW
jgi:hypothetical protein